MNGNKTFQRNLVSSPLGETPLDKDEFYFRIHILMIVASVIIYLTAICWMLWRLVIGGAYEFSIVPVISCVLLAIMLVVTRSMVVIAFEGRHGATRSEVFRAESKRVSVNEWLLRPSPPIGPLTGREIRP